MPAARVQADVSANAFGAQAGAAASRFGDATTRVAGQAMDLMTEEAIRENEARAREGDAALRTFRRSFLYDTENGFLSLQGRAAMDGAADAAEAWQAEVDRIAGTITTERGRELFIQQANHLSDTTLAAVDRHVTTQRAVYEAGASAARIEAGLLDIDASGGSREALDEAIRLARTETELEAEREGWSPEELRVALAERTAAAEERFIEALIANGRAAEALELLEVPSSSAVPVSRGDGAAIAGGPVDIPASTGAWGERHASEMVARGLNPAVTFAMAESESGFANIHTQIRDPETGEYASDAFGPWQFTSRTWNNLVAQHPELGLTAADRERPEAQAVMTAVAVADITNRMESALGRRIDGSDIYLAWFVGEGVNALALLRGGDDAVANAILPNASNGNWLTNHGYGLDTTVGEIRARLGEAAGVAGMPVRYAGADGQPLPIAEAMPAARGPVAHLSPAQRQRLQTSAERQVRADTQEQRADLEERLDWQSRVYLAGETPPGPTATRGELIDAFGADEGQERWNDFQYSRQVGAAAADMRGRTPEEQMLILDKFRPQPGPNFARDTAGAEIVEDAIEAERARNAAILEPRLEAELAMLSAGETPPDPVTRAEIDAASPDEATAQAAWDQLDSIRVATTAVETLPGMTPEEQADLLAMFAPRPGENFIRESERYRIIAEGIERDRELRAADPVAYVMSYNHVVADAFANAETGEEIARAMRLVWAEQEEAGIPVSERGTLARPTVGHILAQWEANPTGADRVALLQSVTTALGDPAMFEATLNQLLAAGLPEAVRVIGGMDLPSQDLGRRTLAAIANTNTEDLRRVIGAGEGSPAAAVDQALAANTDLQNLVRSIMAGGEDNTSFATTITSEVARLAYHLVGSRGMNPSTAATTAVEQVATLRYRFVAVDAAFGDESARLSYRVPIEVDTYTFRAGTLEVLRDPVALQERLGPLFVDVGESELQDDEGREFVQQEAARSLAEAGYWVTSPREDGLLLFWPTGAAAHREDGSQVLFTWDELSEIGRNVSSTSTAPGPQFGPAAAGGS